MTTQGLPLSIQRVNAKTLRRKHLGVPWARGLIIALKQTNIDTRKKERDNFKKHTRGTANGKTTKTMPPLQNKQSKEKSLIARDHQTHSSRFRSTSQVMGNRPATFNAFSSKEVYTSPVWAIRPSDRPDQTRKIKSDSLYGTADYGLIVD